MFGDVCGIIGDLSEAPMCDSGIRFRPWSCAIFSKRWKPTIKCGTFGLCADFIRRFRLKESSILPLRLPVRGTFQGRRGSRSFRMKNASSPVKLTIWKNIPFYHIGSRLPPLLMRLNASGRLVQYGPINRLVVGEEIWSDQSEDNSGKGK